MKKFFTLLLFVLHEINGDAQNCGPFDPSFGNGGKAYGFVSNTTPGSRNLIVQPDNKIIQVVDINNGSHSDFGVLRYKSEGKLDSAFGTNGMVTTAMGAGESHSSAGALQADGKIVVVGSAMIANSRWAFAVVRYNSDGTLDPSFGLVGKMTTSIGLGDDNASALSIQPDGKIVVVGSSRDNFYIASFAIIRYNTNGSVDSTFGQNGKLVFHLGPLITYIGGLYYGRYADEYASAVVVQTDAKIVVAGQSYVYNGCYDYYGGIYCNSAFAMIRYNSNGSVDSSFGANGKVIDSLALLSASAAVLQTDGKILVTGSGTPDGYITKRYQSNGSVDASFGAGGSAITGLTGSGLGHSSRSLAIRSDGKIIVGGTLYTGNSSQFALLRYDNNGIPDSSFNRNGIAFFDIGQAASYGEASGVALQNNKVVVGGTSVASNNTAGNAIVVARLLDSGQLITPVIIAGGPLNFCQNGNVKLSSSETGTIQWYKNNVALTGATQTDYTAASGGSYTVLVSNSKGCGMSFPVVVTTTEPFTPSVTPQGPVYFCVGDSVILTSNSYSGNQWFKDGTIISGSTSPTLTARSTGSYTAKVTLNGCESVASNAIAVMANIIPSAPSITAGGAIIFCSGANVVLTSSALNGNEWYKNGVQVTGSTANTLNVTTSGSYTAKVIVPGCASATSNAIIVTVNNNPPKPPNDWNGTKFSTTSGYAHYQWYRNDTAITGATADNYTPGSGQFGDYKVVVTDNNNCTNTSDQRPYRITAVSNITVGDATLRYYPNPVQATLHIDVPQMSNKKMVAVLYDLGGRKLIQQSLKRGENLIPVQKLLSGVYELQIQYGIERIALKVVVRN